MEMDLHERLKAAKIVNAGGGGEPPVFVEKTVTENGTYIALDDEVDGYSKVTVDVPNRVSDLIDLIERHIVSLDIPDGVTKIGEFAFADCTRLKNVTIPSSVTSIANNAFDNTFIRTITINKPEDSISGAPWGASMATVVWTG